MQPDTRKWATRRGRWWVSGALALLGSLAMVPGAARAEGDGYNWDAITVYVHPGNFKFVTTLPDDGKGKGGGWQEAKAELEMRDPRDKDAKNWKCKVKVGMPLRTEADGKVSPEKAAKVSAEVASKAWKAVLPREPKWPEGVFCSKHRSEMEKIFKTVQPYKTLGASVGIWN